MVRNHLISSMINLGQFVLVSTLSLMFAPYAFLSVLLVIQYSYSLIGHGLVV